MAGGSGFQILQKINEFSCLFQLAPEMLKPNIREQVLKYLNFLQAKVGLEIEFEASLQLLRGENADISHEAANIKVAF